MSDLDGVEAFIRLRRLELTLVAKLDARAEGRGVSFRGCPNLLRTEQAPEARQHSFDGVDLRILHGCFERDAADGKTVARGGTDDTRPGLSRNVGVVDDNSRFSRRGQGIESRQQVTQRSAGIITIQPRIPALDERLCQRALAGARNAHDHDDFAGGTPRRDCCPRCGLQAERSPCWQILVDAGEVFFVEDD